MMTALLLALPALISAGKSSVSWPSIVADAVTQPLPAFDAVSRYVPGTTLGIVNLPEASTVPADTCSSPPADDGSAGVRLTRMRDGSAGGCAVVPSNAMRPVTVSPCCSVTITFERLRPSTGTSTVPHNRIG